MDILLTQSKNGSLTCSKGTVSLHSKFNPEKEAERFVSLIETSYIPSFIVITGPCLGYTEPFLRGRFRESKIIAIQYSTDFAEYSKQWDYSFNLTNTSEAELICDKLFSLIGEEKLFSTLFISWKPSEKAWPEQAAALWNAFKALLSKAESVISTRAFFNRRWFLNSIRFFSSVKKTFIPGKTDKPIVITASGPSLGHSLPFLKKYRESFLLMAASSSIKPLVNNGLIPDYCITTDGGWWAKKHLEPLVHLISNGVSVPLILPPEAAIPHELLDRGTIIPLNYADFPDESLFTNTKLPCLRGERNGTVSGTAAVLAMQLTSSSVFFCGLDLAPSKGYQHTQPNALELINCQKDNRLKPLETRCSASAFSGGASLTIYRNWFSSRNESFYKRVFRLVTEKDKLEPIPRLQDILIDKDVPVCFDNMVKKNAYTKTEVSASTKNARLVIDFLTRAKHQIETSEKSEYNDSWYKMAALKEIIREERKGSLTVSKDIQDKTMRLLDEGISLADRLSKKPAIQ